MGDATISPLGSLGMLPMDLAIPDRLPTAAPAAGGLAGGRAKPGTDPKAMEAAKMFESVLVKQLVDEMKRTIPESGLLSSGVSGQYQDLFWSQLSDEIGKNGGLGLCKRLYAQIKKTTTPDAPSGNL
jgi:Rod binding domain-containing protein